MKLLFRNNGYSISFTDLCIKKYMERLYAHRDGILLVPKNDLFLCSHILARSHYNQDLILLRFNKRLGSCELKAVFCSQCKRDNLFCLKNTLQRKVSFRKIFSSILGYRYLCSTCNVIYCGITNHHFLQGQLNIWVFQIKLKRGLRMWNHQQFHILECDCSIDFSKFNILAASLSSWSKKVSWVNMI